MTARQYNYLSVIYVEERVTPNEIGTLIHTANPTVTSMLNALERDGLIVREQRIPKTGAVQWSSRQNAGNTLRRGVSTARPRPDRGDDGGAPEPDERKKLVDVLVRLGDSFANSSARKKKRKAR